MKKMFNYDTLTTGWEIVVVRELLQEEEIVRFEQVDNWCFNMLTPHPHPELSINGRGPFNSRALTAQDYFVGNGTTVTHRVRRTMETAWAAVRDLSPVFVCTVRETQHNGGYMFFSTEFSACIPEQKKVVALRFYGSPVAICGSIQKYGKRGCTRITQGWRLFVAEHHIQLGDVLVFRFYRGSTVWEPLIDLEELSGYAGYGKNGWRIPSHG